MLQRLANESDHREERLQDCIFRGEMILALSEVPKSLKSWTGLWKVGGAGNEPRDTNALKKKTHLDLSVHQRFRPGPSW